MTLSVSLQAVAGRQPSDCSAVPDGPEIAAPQFTEDHPVHGENHHEIIRSGNWARRESLALSGQADAQYRYTDDKGVSKVTQYKLDIPEPYRDAAVWVGPTGVGKPGLSKEAEQTKLRDDAYRRIGEANSALIKYGAPAPGGARKASGVSSMESYKQQKLEGFKKPLAEMCVASEQRIMIAPGHWEIVGSCSPRD